MGAGVATVGRRPYAVGLYWENSPSGRVSQAAKEAANQPGQQAEFYAVRAGNKNERIPQFGLSPAGAGHKMGMPAFAACLANQQPGSWAGAFRLRDGTVVTVVRDDLIVPDGDQFYPDEAEARDRLLQEIGFGGLQRIYAPEAWSIPGADTMPVSLLLNDKSDVRLRPIAIPKSWLIIGGIAALALLVVLGGGWYYQYRQAQQQAEQDRLRMLENKVKLPLQGQQAVYPPPKRYWESDPLPMDVIRNCHAGLDQVPVAVAGWNLASLTCHGDALGTNWTRGSGFSDLPAQFNIDPNGSSASFSASLTPQPPRGHQDLVDPDEVTRLYLAQDWPGTIATAPDDPPPPPPPGYQGQWNPPPPPWIKRSFTVTVPVLPWSLSTFFGNLPGAVIESLSYAPNGGWTIKGVIYENRR